jgi:hypothetical protein
MESSHTAQPHAAWNNGKLVGQKTPFKLNEIWSIRIRLQMQERLRELALFNLASTAGCAPAISCDFAYATYVTETFGRAARADYNENKEGKI